METNVINPDVNACPPWSERSWKAFQLLDVINPNILFGLTTFVSAFLIFQIQPMFGKAVLPWFGGVPAVWTTCLVFFQCALLVGYAYAYLLSKFLSFPKQLATHCLLVIGSAALLPVIPADIPSECTDKPTFSIILLLLSHVGIQYILLAATSPLLQHWYSHSSGKEVPYRLYALSNLGSLTALLTYPFFIEPNVSVVSQSFCWSVGFVLFVCSCGMIALHLRSGRNTMGQRASITSEWSEIGYSKAIRWLLLSGVSSLALVAITNEICEEVGAGPLLWVLPLALYLLSFVIAFEKPTLYQPRFVGAVSMVVLMVVFAIRCDSWNLLDDFAEMIGWDLHLVYSSIATEIGVYAAALFLLSLICHSELYRSRPSVNGLTAFYLIIATGGALGGVIASVVCPLLFDSLFETELVFYLAFILSIIVFVVDGLRRWPKSNFAVGVSAGVFAATCMYLVASSQINDVDFETIFRSRDFYGVVRVDLEESEEFGIGRAMYHGRTLHGFQYSSEDYRSTPHSYYSTDSGVGLALNVLSRGGPLTVGVVGLGTGTLAAYGRKDDTFDFYEINPTIVGIAENVFSYLGDSQADTNVKIGDARILLEEAPGRHYDMVVLDAFSGDAIPTHLMTREAFETYERKLSVGGVLAVHISNRYIDLLPVVSRIAWEGSWNLAVVDTEEDSDVHSAGSTWALLSRNTEFVNDKTIEPFLVDSSALIKRGIDWTDSTNSLIGLFK